MFYYAFLSNEDKSTYKDIVNAILQTRGIQEAGKTRIKELWKELENRSKNFTNEGKMRKVGICIKVFKKNAININCSCMGGCIIIIFFIYFIKMLVKCTLL